jgi:tetratricopeptide (TPR) repeat protein
LRVAGAVVVVGLALGTVVRNRDYVDPVRLAETVVERWPSGRAHVQLGTLYDAHGDREAAIREYREALAVYPPAEFVLGVALVEQKHFDEGLAHLRAFVNRTPRHDAVVGARDLIGRVLTDRNDFEGASREFELMLAKNASNSRAMVLLAEVRLRQHRTSEAIDLFERARRVSAAVGQDAFVMKRYGDALARSNRLVEAERVFAAAAAAHPRDASLQKLWGRSLAAQGRFAAAAERFRQARVLAPDDPEARELDQAIRQRVGVVRR